jgi:Domain of unknown function (DUF6456)
MQNTEKTTAPIVDYTALFSFLALKPTLKLEKSSERMTLKHEGQFMVINASDLLLLVSKGLVARQEQSLVLTELGKNYLPLNHVQRNTQVTLIEKELIIVNKDESPLSALANRKMTDGSTFLSVGEYEAGERIRTDFTHAHMMPRISANWQAPVSRGSRSDRSNGAQDITHSALCAKARVDAALQCLGRDLSGVVLDICCYLKGFEQVEMERKWPKRSAKFMLKAALSVLALHYVPQAKSNGRVQNWGATDYRPTIS